MEPANAGQPPGRPRRRPRVLELVVVLVLIGLIAATVAVALRESKRRMDARVKCASNLRAIALAAISYADDKRFYPHLSRLRDLDNGGSTSPRGSDVSPRCLRALVHFGYQDVAAPDVFVCPDSHDEPAPLAPEARADARVFGWAGSVTDGANPILTPAPRDADASALTDLSYGWTIKAHTCGGAMSDSALAADLDQRTHPAAGKPGWNVACADGHVTFVPADSPMALDLATPSGRGARYLAIWDASTRRRP